MKRHTFPNQYFHNYLAIISFEYLIKQNMMMKRMYLPESVNMEGKLGK